MQDLGHNEAMKHSELDFELFFKSLKRSLEVGQRPLVVLDIDSTLVHVHTRNQAILNDFLANRTQHWTDKNRIENLSKVELQSHHWGYEPLKSEFSAVEWSELQRHWLYNFFGNDFLEHDVPVAGVKTFINELTSLNIEIVYLTGRDEGRMMSGTVESFKKLNFPISEHARLFLKQDLSQTDEDFKKSVFKQLIHEFQNIWFFDNEPLNLAMCAQNFPTVQNVWVCTTHSGRAEVPPLTLTIKDFEKCSLSHSE